VQCHTLQLVPLPNKTELDEAYQSEYYSTGPLESDPEAWADESRPRHQAVVNLLKDYAVTGKVLDYGTGWGGQCELLAENGFEYLGLELSENMAAYCKKRGLSVHYGDIADIRETDFAALVMTCVFEHLIDHEEWLGHAKRLLCPGGLLISIQPSALFAGFMGLMLRLGSKRLPLPDLYNTFCPPWHTVLFSVRGMTTLAARNGFELIEIRPAPQGTATGLKGAAQKSLQAINRFGWLILGLRWPLVTGHIFVFRKTDAQ